MVNSIRASASYLRQQGVVDPVVGVILGTGLGRLFPKQISDCIALEYHDIPNFPAATVESHQGKLLFGSIGGRKLLAMHGRFHYYEGYTAQQITFPVRVMKELGVKYLIISNAAGNLNPAWQKGDLMLIDDHINLQTDNPLRGKNHEELGPRFPDMSEPYSRKLNESLQASATRRGITLRRGVYAAVSGPNLETRAEYRYLRTIGADVVGMSTVPEVIVANHSGLPCCGVSVLTDNCDPDNLKPVSLAEIIAVSNEAEPRLTQLFADLIGML